MALQTPQKIVEDGITPTYAAAAAGGDNFVNPRGRTFVHFKNTGGSPITATFTPALTATKKSGIGEVTKDTPAIVIGATTGDKMAGPFAPGGFNDAAGRVNITYSATPTGVTLAVIEVPDYDAP